MIKQSYSLFQFPLMNPKQPFKTNLFGVDFIPANLLLANAEQQLIFANLREFRLQQLLEHRFSN